MRRVDFNEINTSSLHSQVSIRSSAFIITALFMCVDGNK